MKKFIALMVVVAVLLTALPAAAMIGMPTGTTYFDWSEFDSIWHMRGIIANNVLYDDVDGEYLMAIALREILNNHPELYEMAARAMLSTIDDYSLFRTQEETESWLASLEGNFGGIGVHIVQTAQGLLVTNLIVGGAAYEAGILPDDVIIQAGGVSLAGITQDQAVQHVRGEVGTDVYILVRRPGVAYPLSFTLTRRIVEEIPVNYTILEDYGVIHLDIRTFNSRTNAYVEATLNSAYEAGITKVLLDLRNNAGGFMNQAVAVASHFVYGERVIVTQQYRNDYTVHYSTLVDKRYDVVVLVNERTISAAEIVAAAIRDNEVGPIVGMRTFGKATVQTVQSMFWGDSITFTIAEYLTPAGRFIQDRGIFPDTIVENQFETFDMNEFGNFTYATTYWVGSSGSDVRLARVALDAVGVPVRDVESYYFDWNLRYAVVEFQHRAGLYPSGALCPNTLVNLFIWMQNTYNYRDFQFEEGLRQLIAN